MRVVRLSVLALVVVFCSVSLPAQSPPQITNTVFDFETFENERVSVLVMLFDPDPGEILTLTFSLVNGPALGISESQLQFQFKSKVFNASSVNVSNQFSVPSGTLGSTIEIRADVTDKDNLTASQTFRYHVVGVNQAPVISLSVRQPGSNAAGTESDPFRYGSLEYLLSIQDDFGVDDFTYGIQIISGSLCVNYPFYWFGREGLTPTVDVPMVATLMALDASATVIDGVFSETIHRTVWVAPEPEGCSISDPLNSVTATASPNPVSQGGTISLIGSMLGDTSPYAAVWYLGSSTSGEQLIANAWQAQYQAPNFATTLNFKFKVNEIAGTRETVKTVPVIVTSSGSDPLDSVTAIATPNPVSKGGLISLIGGMTGDTSPYEAAWFSSSTSGEELIANAWEAQYRARGSASFLAFKFKVSEIVGDRETVKTVSVEVSPSGGGGGGPSPPPADVGTKECREVQFQAQNEVLLGGPYKNHGELVKTASYVVDLYKKNGEISNKCSTCIMHEFRKSIPIEDQAACGWVCPCLDLPGWASLLETEEWTACATSDPAWDPLAALTSNSYLIWSGFQIDSPAGLGFDACVSMDLVEYDFLDLLSLSRRMTGTSVWASSWIRPTSLVLFVNRTSEF